MTITVGNSKLKTQNSTSSHLRLPSALLSLALLATGCKAEAEKSADPAATVVQIGAENVVPVTTGTGSSDRASPES
jgi:hypothetical protein